MAHNHALCSYRDADLAYWGQRQTGMGPPHMGPPNTPYQGTPQRPPFMQGRRPGRMGPPPGMPNEPQEFGPISVRIENYDINYCMRSRPNMEFGKVMSFM